jgi:hypothetical protein
MRRQSGKTASISFDVRARPPAEALMSRSETRNDTGSLSTSLPISPAAAQ